MGIFEGCLLASDVDGTLVVNNRIHPRAVEKIDSFVAQGGTFALSTGRSLGAVSSVLEKIPSIGPSVVCNGCMIYDYASQKTLYEVFVSDGAKERVALAYQRFPNVGIELHCGAQVLVLRRNREIVDHERYERLNSVDICLKDAMAYNWNKALLASENAVDIDEFLPLADCRDDFILAHTSAPVDGRTRHYCEFLPKGITKATATQKLCQLLNIRKGGYFAIGDYYNDEQMVLAADIGAFTADAPEDLRRKADFIAGTAAEGAVADFIDYLETVVTTR